MKKKVVIIGAGPAGLAAACELSKYPQFQVLVLEADEVAGGISRTVPMEQNYMDLGGHRFFTKEERVKKWWFSLFGVQGNPALDDKLLGRKAVLEPCGKDPETEDDLFLIRRRISRIYYKNHFFDYPLSLSLATFRKLGPVTLFQAGFSYVKACLFPLPETSLENFYINRFGRKLYTLFFEGYTEKLWGRHPREIAADWGKQRVKGVSISAVLKDVFVRACGKKSKQVETSLISWFYYPKYGPGQFWTYVATQVQAQGGQVEFHKRVTGFKRDKNRVTHVVCADGTEIAADIVISSMPLKELVAGFPDTPEDIRQIALHLPYRDFVTVGLWVDKLALSNHTAIPTFNGTIPDCWIYVQDTRVKMGRIQIFNNWSPYMVKDCQNTVLLGLEYFCNEGDGFWNLSDDECKEQAIAELKKIGFITDGTHLLASHCERVKKAYPAYFDTYKNLSRVIDYLDSIENLYCIGRNGQHRYNNMDHSVMTAFETVDSILAGNSDKKRIWSVNTESAYHEEKER